MSKDLTDKVAVITGGAGGIGFEIADHFLQNKVKTVIILDINEQLGRKSLEKFRKKYTDKKNVIFLKCDVKKDLLKISEKIFENYKVDILVNNAGILNDLDIRKTMEINVIAVIEWGMKFWEHMTKLNGGNGGTIINTCSIYGFRVDQYMPVYQASKFAVMGFTKSLGHVANFEKSGVRVVAICPGCTYTNMTDNAVFWDAMQKAEFDEFLKVQPWQNADAVGKAAVEVFNMADSGTAWVIEGAGPIIEI